MICCRGGKRFDVPHCGHVNGWFKSAKASICESVSEIACPHWHWNFMTAKPKKATSRSAKILAVHCDALKTLD